MARPRKHAPDTNRMALTRAALREAGGEYYTIALTPEANTTFQSILKETGESKTELINRLVVEAGR